MKSFLLLLFCLSSLSLSATPLYQTLVAFWHFDCAKVPGLSDRKLPYIKNIGQLTITQPRKLSRGPNVKNQLGSGIIDALMHQAIEEKAFPGAVLLVAKEGEIVFKKAYGTHTYTDSTPITLDTLFDLASLTKVVVTSTLIEKLCEEKKMTKEDPLSLYFPEFTQPITIEQLLNHRGGFKADIPPWFNEKDFLALPREKQEEEIWNYIFSDGLCSLPGEQRCYSDLGFILLGKIVEKVAGKSLEECLQEKLLTPLAMQHTAFNPLKHGFTLEEIAPTEEDPIFRKRLIRGTVHDEKADVLGGVSGHAGLFSTAADLFLFMQTTLEKPNRCEWGWEKMPLFGEQAFGHFGFTGTSLWADPQTKQILILLTNRVHPTRNNIKIREVRRKLVESLNLSK